MNRTERRLHEKEHKSKYTDALQRLPPDEWPAQPRKATVPSRIWVSRKFMVQEYPEADDIIRLTVSRVKLLGTMRWADGIEWETLQAIKKEVGYGNRDAVEVYPIDAHVINEANMRHLWVLPYEIPFAWRKRRLTKA